MQNRLMCKLLVGLCLAAAVGPSWRAAADETAAGLAAEVARIVQRLDADRYEVRKEAAAQLRRLASDGQRGQALAEALTAVLLQPGASLEVRTVVRRVLENLPAVPPPEADDAEADEESLERLFADLECDHFARRVGAAERLKWLVGNPAAAAPLMSRLKARLFDAELSPALRQQLTPLYETARGQWLASEAGKWPLAEISDARIERWLDEVAATPAAETGGGQAWSVGAIAERELLDLLAREDCLPRVKAALERRLAKAAAGSLAAERYGRLLDWTRPAMVAEYWQAGRHRGIQHLLVDVPNFSEGAIRPSHFDRIDEHTAHCVSGNTLSPGDYPVGVFFPHPRHDEAQFHLVNLPTPRRRMAYEYLVRADESERMTEISRRTLAALLAQKRLLSERELLMLRNLDAAAVSRFAGPYLSEVDDQQFGERSGTLDIRTSHHAMFCYILATVGTHEAVAGLVAAVEGERIIPPTPSSPYHLGWVAALVIAARDPWAGVDEFLAGLVERPLRLSLREPEGAELGATAAGILLARRGLAPSEFGLVGCDDEYLKELGCPSFRFAAPEARRAVAAWWSEHRAAGEAVP